MSLTGALSLGQSSLAAQQIGLQVTGNNISNSGTDGYSRQVANVVPSGAQPIGNGNYVGTGVTVSSIQRQASDAINSSLRDATSQQSSAQTLSDYLTRVEATFGTLQDNDLPTQLGNFFNSFSTLSTNVSDPGQRAVVIQNGATLASYLTTLRTQLTNINSDATSQITQLATQANGLAGQIAQLNVSISSAEAGGGEASNLRDQRDNALMQLSKIMDVRTVNQPNGMVNVLVGSNLLVDGQTSRGVAAQPATTADGTGATTQLVFANNGDKMTVSSGQLAGLINARDVQVQGAIDSLDTLASGLIQTVNGIHSQGQGLQNFSQVTGVTQVLDPTASLNAATTLTGLPSTPVNGSFNINITDAATGTTTTRQIKVDLLPGHSFSLNDLAAALTGGGVTGTVDATNHLALSGDSSNLTFNFSNDTSGVLAAVGVNTFFTGSDASNIAVNQTIVQNPQLLAMGRDGVPGSNTNALAMALGYTAGSSALKGQSLKDYWSNYIGKLANSSAASQDDVTARTSIHDTIYAQQQAISGVNMDEEAINLIKYQRAFQGSAQYISVINQMMQTVLGMIT